MKLYDINAEIARLLDEGTDPETGGAGHGV